nr:MAG TPA: hypothetical protein [Caudoviricetes sp.]
MLPHKTEWRLFGSRLIIATEQSQGKYSYEHVTAITLRRGIFLL